MPKEQTTTPAETLGLILRGHRVRKRCTQETLARNVGHVYNSTISLAELGKRSIPLWEFIETCLYLEQDPREVLDEYMKQDTRNKIPESVLKLQGIKLKNLAKKEAMVIREKQRQYKTKKSN